jgi:hypothetical protein
LFNREFFERDLDRLCANFAREHQEEAPQVVVHLRDGLSFKVRSRAMASEEWVVLNVQPAGVTRQEPRQVVLPYSAIVAVTFGPGEGSGKRIGFKFG